LRRCAETGLIQDDEMNTLKPLFAVSIMIGMMALTACDHPKKRTIDSKKSSFNQSAG
jgi:hypothetical protein